MLFCAIVVFILAASRGKVLGLDESSSPKTYTNANHLHESKQMNIGTSSVCVTPRVNTASQGSVSRVQNYTTFFVLQSFHDSRSHQRTNNVTTHQVMNLSTSLQFSRWRSKLSPTVVEATSMMTHSGLVNKGQTTASSLPSTTKESNISSVYRPTPTEWSSENYFAGEKISGSLKGPPTLWLSSIQGNPLHITFLSSYQETQIATESSLRPSSNSQVSFSVKTQGVIFIFNPLTSRVTTTTSAFRGAYGDFITPSSLSLNTLTTYPNSSKIGSKTVFSTFFIRSTFHSESEVKSATTELYQTSKIGKTSKKSSRESIASKEITINRTTKSSVNTLLRLHRSGSSFYGLNVKSDQTEFTTRSTQLKTSTRQVTKTSIRDPSRFATDMGSLTVPGKTRTILSDLMSKVHFQLQSVLSRTTETYDLTKTMVVTSPTHIASSSASHSIDTTSATSSEHSRTKTWLITPSTLNTPSDKANSILQVTRRHSSSVLRGIHYPPLWTSTSLSTIYVAPTKTVAFFTSISNSTTPSNSRHFATAWASSAFSLSTALGNSLRQNVSSKSISTLTWAPSPDADILPSQSVIGVLMATEEDRPMQSDIHASKKRLPESKASKQIAMNKTTNVSVTRLLHFNSSGSRFYSLHVTSDQTGSTTRSTQLETSTHQVMKTSMSDSSRFATDMVLLTVPVKTRTILSDLMSKVHFQLKSVLSKTTETYDLTKTMVVTSPTHIASSSASHSFDKTSATSSEHSRTKTWLITPSTLNTSSEKSDSILQVTRRQPSSVLRGTHYPLLWTSTSLSSILVAPTKTVAFLTSILNSTAPSESRYFATAWASSTFRLSTALGTSFKQNVSSNSTSNFIWALATDADRLPSQSVIGVLTATKDLPMQSYIHASSFLHSKQFNQTTTYSAFGKSRSAPLSVSYRSKSPGSSLAIDQHSNPLLTSNSLENSRTQSGTVNITSAIVAFPSLKGINGSHTGSFHKSTISAGACAGAATCTSHVPETTETVRSLVSLTLLPATNSSSQLQSVSLQSSRALTVKISQDTSSLSLTGLSLYSSRKARNTVLMIPSSVVKGYTTTPEFLMVDSYRASRTKIINESKDLESSTESSHLAESMSPSLSQSGGSIKRSFFVVLRSRSMHSQGLRSIQATGFYSSFISMGKTATTSKKDIIFGSSSQEQLYTNSGFATVMISFAQVHTHLPKNSKTLTHDTIVISSSQELSQTKTDFRKLTTSSTSVSNSLLPKDPNTLTKDIVGNSSPELSQRKTDIRKAMTSLTPVNTPSLVSDSETSAKDIIITSTSQELSQTKINVKKSMTSFSLVKTRPLAVDPNTVTQDNKFVSSLHEPSQTKRDFTKSMTSSNVLKTLSPSEDPKQFNVILILDMAWKTQYTQVFTPEYQALVSEIETQLTQVLNASIEGFLFVQVQRLWESSVGVDLVVFVIQTAYISQDTLKRAVIEGQTTSALQLPLKTIHVLEVPRTSSTNPPSSPSSDDGSFELWKIVLIVSCIIVFLLLVVIIFLAIKVRRGGKYKVRNKSKNLQGGSILRSNATFMEFRDRKPSYKVSTDTIHANNEDNLCDNPGFVNGEECQTVL